MGNDEKCVLGENQSALYLKLFQVWKKFWSSILLFTIIMAYVLIKNKFFSVNSTVKDMFLFSVLSALVTSFLLVFYPKLSEFFMLGIGYAIGSFLLTQK